MRDCDLRGQTKTATHLYIDTQACERSPKSFIKKETNTFKKVKHAQKILQTSQIS